MTNTYKLLVLPGDGIGPEVMNEALKISQCISELSGVNFVIEEDEIGGAAYDKYGTPLADETLEKALSSDAVMLGAVGGQKWDDLEFKLRPEQGLLKIRKELDLFANLRPALCFESMVEASSLKPELVSGLDIMIVRELTGGIYFGEPRGIVSNEEPNYAFNTMIYNEEEIRRIAKVAFESAQKRNKKLCSVEKANVLEVSKFWRSIVSEMSSDYPDVELSHQLADNTAMQLVLNPNQFDVIVSSNLFGDILSDIAATLTGSIGMLPSASLDSSFKGMFEPCHGSAPDIAGKNLANPLAMISSLSMALRYSLNQADISDKIDNAIKKFIQAGYRTIDIASDGDYLLTSDVAKKIIEIIKDE